jgi:isoleucyl-tRNA synthetase
MVAIDTTLTPDLKDEGTAREVVHRIQNLRRSAGFELTDRITTFYGASQGGAEALDELRRVMSGYAPYIQQETLSDEVVEGVPPESSASEKLKLEGTEVVLAVQRV